jgi:hypothetical protein
MVVRTDQTSSRRSGGGGLHRLSPLFFLRQRRRICGLSLRPPLTRQSDAIASSNRFLNFSLSSGSNLRICHRSAIHPRLSRAFSNSFATSVIFFLRTPIPYRESVRLIGPPTAQNQTYSRSEMPSQTDGIAPDVLCSLENRGTGLRTIDFFRRSLDAGS